MIIQTVCFNFLFIGNKYHILNDCMDTLPEEQDFNNDKRITVPIFFLLLLSNTYYILF